MNWWKPSITTDPEKIEYEEIISNVMAGYVSHRNDPQKKIDDEKIRKQKYTELMTKYVEEHKDYYSPNNHTTVIIDKR